MAKATNQYVCQTCGTVASKWSGKCTGCDSWNTLVEEVLAPESRLGAKKAGAGSSKRGLALEGLNDGVNPPPRTKIGIGEFDRVLGGGLVTGSVTLIGGEPGIGKSTLLLQATAAAATSGKSVIYISGEEAADQVRLRAQRLGLSQAPLQLAATTDVRAMIATLDGPEAPDIAVIDSVQTLYLDALESAPGSVAQVRGSSQELIRVAKKRGIALLLVGHVTKEGALAGPKTLEHMVDTVLQFEGDRSHHFRLLRTLKNRFGPADEIGVFEMAESGMREVSNPSELFLYDRTEPVSGTAVFAGIEGSRPVLVEIQALVSPSPLGTPRRAVVGWDSGRLSMILAVLETRCGLAIGANDVYLNVAGGLRISEPGADLAVAAALVSSFKNQPLPRETILFGEIGLSGEIRSVAQAPQRLKEAEKLGFTRAWTPSERKTAPKSDATLDMERFRHVSELALAIPD